MSEQLEYARTFFTLQQNAVLSTLIRSELPDIAKFPFGSMLPYDVTSDGKATICISRLSEHFQNLTEDPRASLFVFDPFGIHEPQSLARICVVGNFSRVLEAEHEKRAESFARRFPKSPVTKLGDFSFFDLQPERIRWIAGFSEMQWFSGKDFCTMPSDPVAYAGWDIIRHMNEDHSDALVDIVRAYTPLDPEEEDVTLVFVSKQGFTVRVTNAGQCERVNIPFPQPVSSSLEVRQVLETMLKSARLRH